MVTEKQVQEALDTLVETDELIGDYAADVKRAEFMVKHTEALRAKELNAGGADMRRWHARTHPDWQKYADDEVEATANYRKTLARRETATLRISVWQSQIKAQSGPRP